MAYDGWFAFDGSEIINATRTEQYCTNLGIGWLKPQFKNPDISLMLGHGARYLTPLLDDAPWIDPDAGESEDFLGLYPLAIDGVESATRTATVMEGIGNGGAVVGVRHGTKSMVFSGALCATSEDGAEYGLRWLKQVLNGNPCEGADCSGGTLCYLISSPALGERFGNTPGYGYGGGTLTAQACLTQYQRNQYNVTVTQGPTVTSKRSMSDGGAVWTVTFTAVAANPYEYGSELPIIEGFMHPTEDPWAEGITGGTYTPGPYLVVEQDCDTQVFRPVYDPLCPALIPPPLPATVAMGCFTKPQNWYRRHITIPEENIPLWGDVVPRIEVHTTDELRAMRLRFYADPYGEGNPGSDPCGYCGDILISYIPANSTLVFDGVEQSVYVQYQGSDRRRADSLVFRTDGTPFEWPVLSCGMGYIVTFDLPQTQVPPLVDLSLTPRVL